MEMKNSPTTTGCVLSSVATAEYPAIHGMIGWYNYNRERNIDYYTLLFKDRKNKKNLEALGIKSQDIYQCDSKITNCNNKFPVYYAHILLKISLVLL